MGDGDVLVRTCCSGVSAGTELLAYRGDIDPDIPLDEKIGALGGTFRFPFRFGYSCAESSRRAARHSPPARGCSPSIRIRTVRRTGRTRGPLAGVEPATAVLFPLVETALQITLDAGPLIDEPVVMFGLGPVGILTAVMLQRAGAQVLAGEPLPWRREDRGRARRGRGGTGGPRCDTFARGVTDGVPLVVEVCW